MFKAAKQKDFDGFMAVATDPLSIVFDRIMDHALVQTMMQLRDEDQNLIDRYWEILDCQKQIKFIPSNKWKTGIYSICFDTRIEDVSGNNLQNLLDHTTKDQDIDEVFQYINFMI